MVHNSLIFAHFGAVFSGFSSFSVVQLAISTSEQHKSNDIIYLIQRKQKYAHFAI